MKHNNLSNLLGKVMAVGRGGVVVVKHTDDCLLPRQAGVRTHDAEIPIGEGTTWVFHTSVQYDVELWEPYDIELIFVIFETGLTYYATESDLCEFWPFLAADPHFIEHGNNPSFPSVRITPSSASTMLSRTTFVTGGASET